MKGWLSSGGLELRKASTAAGSFRDGMLVPMAAIWACTSGLVRALSTVQACSGYLVLALTSYPPQNSQVALPPGPLGISTTPQSNLALSRMPGVIHRPLGIMP